MGSVGLCSWLISELLPSIEEAWPGCSHLIYDRVQGLQEGYSTVDTIFTIFVTALIITLIILYNQRIIATAQGLVSSLFNVNELERFRRDVVPRANLNIFLIIGTTILSYLLARTTYDRGVSILGVKEMSILLRFAIIVPILPLYIAFKRWAFGTLAWVNRERALKFLYGYNLVYIAFIILLLLLVMLIVAIVPHISGEKIEYCIITSLSIGIILFIVRGYMLIISKGFSHSFWILYLCTLEILPLIVALELLRR